MVTVKISFRYDPDEPDEEHPSGVSETEYERWLDRIAALDGYDVEIKRDDKEQAG